MPSPAIMPSIAYALLTLAASASAAMMPAHIVRSAYTQEGNGDDLLLIQKDSTGAQTAGIHAELKLDDAMKAADARDVNAPERAAPEDAAPPRSACITIAIFCGGVFLTMMRGILQEADDSEAKGDAHAQDDAHVGDHHRRALTRRATVGFGGEAVHRAHSSWSPEDSHSTMSQMEFIANMFADLCPPGFLPLAYGLSTTGFIPALIILVLFYSVCAFSMYLVAKTCELTGQITYAGHWEKVFGKGTSWIPVAVVVMVCLGGEISYACMYADIFTRLMPNFGLNLPRWMCLVMFTVFPTMPLCLLKDMSALAPSSTFAMFAVVFTAVVMVVRYADGSYVEGGQYYAHLEPKPDIPADHMWNLSSASPVFVNALAMAFMAHYNGCKYYRELEGHTPRKMLKCTCIAMGLSTLLYAITMIIGFKTFGFAADGVILKNYAKSDLPINIARVGLGFSIIASYPLMFSGLREALLQLLKTASPQQAKSYDSCRFQDLLSIGVVCLITFVSALVTDAGVVVGVAGAVCGTAIIYVIPPLLYAGARSFPDPSAHSVEILLVRCLAAGGCCLGTVGLLASLGIIG